MPARYLITTALRSTWKFDVPVLFLGKWATLHSESKYWEDLDYMVLPYHWDDRNKLYKDYKYSITLMNILMPIISKSLNKVHGLDNTEKYWRMIIAPWLGQFIQVTLDRWCMIDKAFTDYDINGTTIVNSDPDEIIPANMEDFRSMIEGDTWNHHMYAEIIKFRGMISPQKIDHTYSSPDLEKNRHIGFSNNSAVSRLLRKVNYHLTKNNNFFFVDYAVNGKRQIILDLMLGQLINIQQSPTLPITFTKDSKEMRDNFLEKYISQNQFESFLKFIIPKSMPSIYLAGFKQLRRCVSETKCWPLKPKVIICSTAHNSNDFFKVWAAENRIQNDSKLVIAQHGGNYGLAKWNFFEDLELSIADYYFSWGWKKTGIKNIIPMPSLKIDRYRKKLRPDRQGGILIITGNLPRYSYFLSSLPIGPQVEEYFLDMFTLVSNFNAIVFKKTVVRIYPYKDYEWSQKNRWLESFPDIKFDDDSKTMYKSMCDSRVALGTYNSTTILELLAANVPIVLYWNPIHSEIRKSEESVFEGLIQAKILHQDPKNAADFINNNWENINDWWNSNKVQVAVKNFCDVFAKTSEKALEDWKQNLKYVANK